MNPSPDEAYYYVDNPGLGVDVYIVKVGINHIQDEFNDDNSLDRPIEEINYSDKPNSYKDDADGAGHGTRFASAIRGNHFGAAKSAPLRNVKYEENRTPNAARFMQAMEDIIDKHNAKKSQSNIKGSIIKCLSRWGKCIHKSSIEQSVQRWDLLGCKRWQSWLQPQPLPFQAPKSHLRRSQWQRLHPVTGHKRNRFEYGQGVNAMSTPGRNIILCDKNGGETLTTGTSFAAAYVSGILAIFYSVEAKAVNPHSALTRLMAQTDIWMTFPAGTDWKNAPAAFASAGNRKGAKLDPPKQYISSPSASTQGCQSPIHSPCP